MAARTSAWAFAAEPPADSAGAETSADDDEAAARVDPAAALPPGIALLDLDLGWVDVPWDRVHDEAEVLEHHISEELEEAIAAKLGNPTRDPHGDPIPTRELVIEETPSRSLERRRSQGS